MKTSLVVTKIQTLLAAALTPTTVVEAFDLTHDLTDEQVAVECSASTELRNAAGLPVAWRVNARCQAATHKDDDEDGSTRRGLIDGIAAWAATVAASTLSVTGYMCDGVVSIDPDESAEVGENYVGQAIRIEMMYSAT